MRVAVFRAAEDGRRTASRLAERGHVAVLAPVLRIVPTSATVPAGSADALVFTSTQAPAALASHPDGIAHLRDLPCWCVGDRTAAAARAAGFGRINQGQGDAAQLATAIMAEPRPSAPVLVAGRDRKPDLERILMVAGMVLAVVEAYAAEAEPEWPEPIVASLASATAALHYSRRSATLAHRLAALSGLGEQFGAWAHFCLSQDVADGLATLGVMATAVAASPDETTLLTLLER